MFKFGVEHEVAFLDQANQFTDFVSASFTAFQKIIAELPTYESDAQQLVIGDAGIRVKRWYMEGLERFDPEGNLLTCLIKGLEIRTSPHTTIMGAIAETHNKFSPTHHRRSASGSDTCLNKFSSLSHRICARSAIQCL